MSIHSPLSTCRFASLKSLIEAYFLFFFQSFASRSSASSVVVVEESSAHGRSDRASSKRTRGFILLFYGILQMLVAGAKPYARLIQRRVQRPHSRSSSKSSKTLQMTQPLESRNSERCWPETCILMRIQIAQWNC